MEYAIVSVYIYMMSNIMPAYILPCHYLNTSWDSASLKVKRNNARSEAHQE